MNANELSPLGEGRDKTMPRADVWPINGSVSSDVSVRGRRLEQAALRLLEESIAELTNEENKSTRVLAAFTAVVGALITGLIAGRWSPESLAQTCRVVWWLGAGCVFAALALVASSALYGERLAKSLPASSTSHDSTAIRDWLHELITHPGQEPASRLLRVCRTIGRKRRLLRGGVAAITIGLVLCLVSGVAGR
ncbi:hypothetical protein [Actinoplanes solisilvae]|uniref:hypothetical protein n=1 Tax=Actinoplanes solisilvae TaxID=2486853 RepID=UPI000FD88A91|nr:hypothetical protein [Actinoplanes solisilvae]